MAESANDIMARGGANSDSLRLQADLATMHEWAGPKDMNAAADEDVSVRGSTHARTSW